MRLKKLELLGFKSFPERTTVRFPSGVTGIVGPNGCGKTNILDALRWALGEQRPTLLRGGKMEDVIFNGSQNMKPLGMSEVTLTIENDRGVLPSEYTELQITRRLFRSGESEYLMNKNLCRLKDITDLFADTGMGSNAYSVIQQQMIDAIISDKTEDRRLLFEEAAGITKYKSRKKAALRKLEATENDLARLKDIVAEVKSQMTSLDRQMKKAERYQAVREELKTLELTLGRILLDTLEREAKGKRLSLVALADNITACEATLDLLAATQEAELQTQAELDQRLQGLNAAIHEKSAEGHSIDQRLATLRERIATLASSAIRNTQEIAVCDQRLEALTLEEATLRDTLASNESALTGLYQEIQNAQEESDRADRAAIETRQVRESVNAEIAGLEARLSSGRNDTANLSEQTADIDTTIASAVARLSEIETLVAEKSHQRDALSVAVRETDERIVALGERLRSAESESDTESATGAQMGDEIARLTGALEGTQARAQILEEMIARHDGFTAGVSAALDEKQLWPNLVGPLADCVAPQNGYAFAIDAILDDIAGRLVARDRHTALDILRRLRDERRGRATVYVLSDSTSQSQTRAPLAHPLFVGWADALVSYSVGAECLVSDILRHSAVFGEAFDNLPQEEILAAIHALPEGCQIATVGGSLYRGESLISGGASVETPRVGRRERLEETKRRAAELELELAKTGLARTELTARVLLLRGSMVAMTQDLEKERISRSDAERNLNEASFTVRQLLDEGARLTRERSVAQTRREALGARQYALELDVDQLRDLKIRLEANLQTALETELARAQDAERAAENTTRQQVRLVEERSTINQLTDRIRHQQEMRAEVTLNREAKKTDIERATTESQSAQVDIGTLAVELKAVFDQRAEIMSQENVVRAQRTELAEGIRQRESSTRETRSRKEKAVAESHQIDLRLAALSAESSSILNRVLDEYGVDLIDYQPPEAAPEMSDSEREAQRIRLEDLRQRLKGFGPVNLLAIEEFQVTTDRFTHLSAQLSDLLSAKSTLEDTIEKINDTARDMFRETFEQARTNFKAVFLELFQGGECDIRLMDEADPLECDIDIIAKPKGKKLVTITQMSGGERALTAISLLFSLYLVKPSPFCILDEIDAPLDDANCHRFLRLIRRFSDQTQFIVITHNKITMEAADQLYGVTMERPGISKLVSVRFDDVGPDGIVRAKNTTAEEREETAEEIIPRRVALRLRKSAEVVDNHTGASNGAREKTVLDELDELDEAIDTESDAEGELAGAVSESASPTPAGLTGEGISMN